MSIKDLKNTTVMSVQKFHTKYWIEGTYYSCSWRKRFNCDQCGKTFARGCYLKVFMKKTLNSIVITVAKISPKLSWIRENTGLKLQITVDHENKKIQLWSMWQKFCQSIQFTKTYKFFMIHKKYWIEITNYTSKLFMKVFWFSSNKIWILK